MFYDMSINISIQNKKSVYNTYLAFTRDCNVVRIVTITNYSLEMIGDIFLILPVTSFSVRPGLPPVNLEKKTNKNITSTFSQCWGKGGKNRLSVWST